MNKDICIDLMPEMIPPLLTVNKIELFSFFSFFMCATSSWFWSLMSCIRAKSATQICGSKHARERYGYTTGLERGLRLRIHWGAWSLSKSASRQSTLTQFRIVGSMEQALSKACRARAESASSFSSWCRQVHRARWPPNASDRDKFGRHCPFWIAKSLITFPWIHDRRPAACMSLFVSR